MAAVAGTYASAYIPVGSRGTLPQPGHGRVADNLGVGEFSMKAVNPRGIDPL